MNDTLLRSLASALPIESSPATLLTSADVEEFLRTAEQTETPNYLEGCDIHSIQREIRDSLYAYYSSLPPSPENIRRRTVEEPETQRKLAGYRFVDEIYQLHRGKHVRWLRHTGATPARLTNGGIVVDVKFQENGVHILCKTGSRFSQYKFDDCFTYQKISDEEWLILTAHSLSSESTGGGAN